MFSRREQISRFLCKQCSYEETCLDKYGTKNSSQCQEIKEKFQKTNLEKYGNVCSLNGEEQIKKKKQTWINHFGKTNPFQKDSVRKTVEDNCLKNYGVKYHFQRKEVQISSRQTMLEKYGTFFHVRKYVFDGLHFDSFWEICFYIKNRDEGKVIIREPMYFNYFIGEKEHFYFVDFLIDGVLFEVKSSYWIKRTTQEKMDCILKNNVNLISDNEIKDYIKYVSDNYPNLKKELKNTSKRQ